MGASGNSIVNNISIIRIISAGNIPGLCGRKGRQNAGEYAARFPTQYHTHIIRHIYINLYNYIVAPLANLKMQLALGRWPLQDAPADPTIVFPHKMPTNYRPFPPFQLLILLC